MQPTSRQREVLCWGAAVLTVMLGALWVAAQSRSPLIAPLTTSVDRGNWPPRARDVPQPVEPSVPFPLLPPPHDESIEKLIERWRDFLATRVRVEAADVKTLLQDHSFRDRGVRVQPGTGDRSLYLLVDDATQIRIDVDVVGHVTGQPLVEPAGTWVRTPDGGLAVIPRHKGSRAGLEARGAARHARRQWMAYLDRQVRIGDGVDTDAPLGRVGFRDCVVQIHGGTGNGELLVLLDDVTQICIPMNIFRGITGPPILEPPGLWIRKPDGSLLVR